MQMILFRRQTLAAFMVAAVSTCMSAAEIRAEVSVIPDQIALRGRFARQQILVMLPMEDREVDLTREAFFTIDPAGIVAITKGGVVTPIADGAATIVVTLGRKEARVPVTVEGASVPRSVTFERDIQPVLSRYGCNSGPCHGKARGQNGFKLSLLGYDNDFDYAAIASEARGRRVFPAAPEQSLLLRKPSAQNPHGGGKILPVGSEPFEMLRRWIENGAPRDSKDAATLVDIRVTPEQRIMRPGEQQQLLIIAEYSDGRTVDVTPLSSFQSNESAVAEVNEDGLVDAGPVSGQAAIMARYMGTIAVTNVLIPQPGSLADDYYTRLPRNNFIDDHVWRKLEQLGITASQPADDATFHRRAYLDVIGRLPAPSETLDFLEDKSSDKREQLVDRLLERPEYADYWANKWADLLRPNPYRVGIKAVFNLDAWLRDAFRENKPYDQFVREIITAQGSTFRNGPATIFRDRRSPDEIATVMSQLFLGVRLECAKCHHHPFEVWGQDDFYGFSAYFARIGRKGRGLSPPISGSEEIIFTADRGNVEHPVTGAVMDPKVLFGNAPAPEAYSDPRESLADWVTSKDNPYFAKVIVNRVWADLMGRGLVDPVDDLRATNPPTNAPLLDALATEFCDHRYDLKRLIRTMMSSYVYGLSAEPTDNNLADIQNYSRHYRQRLRAEVLLDAISDVTGVPERFDAMPPGSRAMQLWTHRADSLFLDSFGRPDANQDPPCERMPDTTLVQTLHLMNSPNLYRKVTSDRSRVAALAASEKSESEIVRELYLLVYCRLPTERELTFGEEWYGKPEQTRRKATEDLLWALLNTPEFVFKN